MLERRGEADLELEPVPADPAAQVGVQDLEGDLAVVLLVADQVHRPHAPAPQLPHQGVAAGEGCREGVQRDRHVEKSIQAVPYPRQKGTCRSRPSVTAYLS